MVSADEMRALDRRAIEEFGIPSIVLMEHAGAGAADIAEKHFTAKKITVVCGKGNNGGDGFVAARHLANRGYDVRVIAAGISAGLKGDAAVNFAVLEKMNVPVLRVDSQAEMEKAAMLVEDADLLIDALFGVGFQHEPREPFTSLISLMNESGRKILAVDLPSGLDSDTGEIRGVAVKAAVTAALGMPKRGLYEREGPLCAGRIFVVDIGLPACILPSA